MSSHSIARPEVDPIIGKHLVHLKRINARKATIAHRSDNLRRVHQRLGKPLLEATADDLDRWQDSLNVSASSVATYTAHVRSFYHWVMDQELLAVNPARNLAIPKIHPGLPRPIPEKDLEKALEASRFYPMLRCWLLLAGFCGLRAGEVAAVQRADLRLDPHGEGGFLAVHGKGGHERIVRVPPAVLRELLNLNSNRGHLFTSRNGRPLTANRVTFLVSRFFANLGLPYTLHTLRHRFATGLADIGADVRDIQNALGHANLATTTRYVAYNARRGASSVDLLSEALGGKP